MTPISRAALAIPLAIPLAGLLLTAPVPAIAQAATQGPAGANDVFVLRQLIEIQNELRSMRKEMDELRRRMDQQAGAAPSARAGARPAAPQAAAAAPSPPPTIEVPLVSTDPSLGDSAAQVVMVEFSDFQCPFCARFHAKTFPEIKKRYIDTGKVRYVLKDYPLPMHPKAPAASIAARCAGEQDRYWDMKEALFTRQRELGDDLYKSLASDMGLDAGKFTSCLASDQVREEVDAAAALGQKVGVSGTPTFFIGHRGDGKVTDARRLVGAQPITAFSAAIDGLLAAR